MTCTCEQAKGNPAQIQALICECGESEQAGQYEDYRLRGKSTGSHQRRFHNEDYHCLWCCCLLCWRTKHFSSSCGALYCQTVQKHNPSGTPHMYNCVQKFTTCLKQVVQGEQFLSCDVFKDRFCCFSCTLNQFHPSHKTSAGAHSLAEFNTFSKLFFAWGVYCQCEGLNSTHAKNVWNWCLTKVSL